MLQEISEDFGAAVAERTVRACGDVRGARDAVTVETAVAFLGVRPIASALLAVHLGSRSLEGHLDLLEGESAGDVAAGEGEDAPAKQLREVALLGV